LLLLLLLEMLEMPLLPLLLLHLYWSKPTSPDTEIITPAR
jgi:hypothetical protein